MGNKAESCLAYGDYVPRTGLTCGGRENRPQHKLTQMVSNERVKLGHELV